MLSVVRSVIWILIPGVRHPGKRCRPLACHWLVVKGRANTSRLLLRPPQLHFWRGGLVQCCNNYISPSLPGSVISCLFNAVNGLRNTRSRTKWDRRSKAATSMLLRYIYSSIPRNAHNNWFLNYSNCRLLELMHPFVLNVQYTVKSPLMLGAVSGTPLNAVLQGD